MARNRVRKTAIGLTSAEDMQKALNLYHSGVSLRKVAERTGVPYTTIFRYAKKQRQFPLEKIRLTPKYNSRQVFSTNEEDELVKYLLLLAKMCFGMTTIECRKLAYEMALRNNKQIPENWGRTKQAGLEWFKGFKKRHPILSIRSPEGCSLSRMTAFNKHNVSLFFDNLQKVYLRSETMSNGSRVYNLDEIATTTVQNPKKIIAEKGVKQVNKCTSGERGQNVTTCYIVNALGTALPPAMIFPRKNFKEHMINGAPPGTLGLATPTGWMTSDIFPQVIDHFVKQTLSSKENPTLLIMDNHESHISLATIERARENGITILTLSPHGTHRLQPLDVSVFASFRSHYNSAVDNWMLHHPGKPMTIYQIAECVGVAHDRSMTPSNIKSGFRRTGIFPFDRNIFNENDFMTSAVSDRPKEVTENPVKEKENIEPNGNKEFISPHIFKGFPMAEPRKSQKSNRRKGRSMIATDTPEKDMIADREQNKRKVLNKSKLEHAKKKIVESSDEEDVDDTISLYSETEDWRPEVDPNFFEELGRSPIIGDFVLVQFRVKEKVQKNIYYIAQVLKEKDDRGEIEVKFYRKHTKMIDKFVLPLVPDMSLIPEADIKMILPKPTDCGKTKRQTGLISFEIGFNDIDIR